MSRMSSTRTPLRKTIAVSAVCPTRDVPAPYRTKTSWAIVAFVRSRRRRSPRRWKAGASDSELEREISVRSRSKNAAPGTRRSDLRENRERLANSARAERGDGLGERHDGGCRLRLGCDLSDRTALVGRLAHDRVEWNPGEQRHAHLVGECLPA